MKRFAVVQHSYSEFLGLIESQLEKRDIGFTYHRVFLGQDLPGSGLLFDALFLLGGPMSPLEAGKYPWLAQELQVIARFRQARRPIVGIGLGALLLAQFEGAELRMEPYHNVYFTTAHATDAGRDDPLAQAVDGERVLVWAPGKAVLPSHLSPTMVDDEGNWIAFRPEEGVVGMLFRPEMKPGMIEDIIMEDGRDLPENIADLMEEMRRLWPNLQKVTDRVVVALVQDLGLMRERHKPPVFALRVQQGGSD